MKRLIKYFMIAAFSAVVFWGSEASSLTAYAWGDNSDDGQRPLYTIDEIENGALGSNGSNADNYPGIIVFNSIINNRDNNVLDNEANFVGAREDIDSNSGEAVFWNGDSITVEDGKIYKVRLYVHNNNPNGEDAAAEDVHVSFNIPTGSAREVQINGFIESSNAVPSMYWDSVNFESDIPFHLEYIYGSALLENNGIGANGGLRLSDKIVSAASGGTLIGYSGLNGRIPGCYQYASYIMIKVKAVFDYGFAVENVVRRIGSEEGNFGDTVDAEVGDTLEFQITYQNNDEFTHSDVMVADILPSGLEYVPQTTMLYDMEHIDGIKVDDIITEGQGGINIGSYAPGTYAQVCFKAKVVGSSLDDGRNTLVNGAKVRVGQTTLQSHSEVDAYSVEILKTIAVFGIALLAAFALPKILFKQYIGAKKP